MSDQRKVRVLIIDDHALFRESVARLLTAEADCEIAGHCASVTESLQILARTPVDLVLLDFDLGYEKGTDFLQKAQEQGFAGKVVVVTAGITDLEAKELSREGVCGIFMKHGSATSLAQCVKEVMAGNFWFEARPAAAATFEHVSEKRITTRERQVLRLVLEGLANKEIADRMNISESAVKGSLQQLFDKSGVRTRSQLVRVALDRYRNLL